jgi:hypothetical protein
MLKFSRISASIVAAALLAACGGDKSKADSALANDTAMARDLALAQKDTAAQPQLTDVPATPATKSPAPARPAGTKTASTKTSSSTKAPAATPRGPTTGVIQAGTALNVRANNELCTNTNKVGDKFTATVNEAVVGSNGATIPAGATVTLTVTKLNRSENVNDPIQMEFSVDEVSFGGKSYALSGSTISQAPTIDKVRNQPKSKDAQKVVGGAAIGAIAGQVLGKNTKSTVIGAAAGAAAGAAVAAGTANYEGCIRAGRTFVVTLGSALTLAV